MKESQIKMKSERQSQYLDVDDFILPLPLWNLTESIELLSNASQPSIFEEIPQTAAIDEIPIDIQFQQFNFEPPQFEKKEETTREAEQFPAISSTFRSSSQYSTLQLRIQLQKPQMANKYLLRLLRYNEETRKDKVLRYLQKKSFRKFVKKVCYDQRRCIAQGRKRVKGRFAASKQKDCEKTVG